MVVCNEQRLVQFVREMAVEIMDNMILGSDYRQQKTKKAKKRWAADV